MINTISVVPIVSASVAGAIGIYFIFVYLKGGKRPSQLAFGLTSLAVALYSVGSTGLYNSINLVQGTLWLRVQVTSLIIFVVSYFFFITYFTETPFRSYKATLLVFLAVAAILIQLFDHSSMTWNMQEPFVRLFTFFGRPYVVYESAPGPLSIGTFIGGVLIFIHIFGIIIRAKQRLSLEKIRPLLISSTLIFIAIVNDMMISAGFYKFIYLLDIAFLIIILFLAFLLTNTVLDAAVNKDALDKANQELAIHHRELENLVEERTRAFQQQAEYFESLVFNSPIAIIVLDNYQRVTNCNPAFEKMFGYTLKEAINKDLDSLIASDEVVKEAQALTISVLKGEKIVSSGQRKRKDGSLVNVDIFGVPVFVNGQKLGVLGLYQDITDRLLAEQTLKESEMRYRSLFEDSPISLWEEDFCEVKKIIDQLKRDGLSDLRAYLQSNTRILESLIQSIKIINLNQATVYLYKANNKEELYTGLIDRIPKTSYPALIEEFVSLASGNHEHVNEYDQKNFNDEKIHVAVRLFIPPGFEDSWEKVFVSVIDMTERKNHESNLQYLSTHDQLTNLANRSLLFDRLKHAISHAFRNQKQLAVFFLDLDGFKSINDQYGHRIGDLLLVDAANRLRENLRESDTIARVGGDEFVLILENLEDPKGLQGVAQKILQSIAAPYHLEGHTCNITTSIGISIYPADGLGPEQLVSNADTAMYLSKQRGKNKISFYDEVQERATAGLSNVN